MTTSQLLRAVGLLALLAFLTVTTGIWGLVIVLGIVFLVFLHELGHYLAAKRAGMKVTEFFIGFGPRIWSFKRGETEYGLKVAPLGAYVKIIGMNNLEEVPIEDEARSYRQGRFLDRLIVVLAGPMMNFLQAFVAIFIILAVLGAPGGSITKQPNPEHWKVVKAYPGTGAAVAGLKPGDKITSVNGTVVRVFSDLLGLITKPGHPQTPIAKSVHITYLRAGLTHSATVTLHPYVFDGATVCCLGVESTVIPLPTQRVNPIVAVPRSVESMVAVTGKTLGALGGFFSASGLHNFGNQVIHAQSNHAAASRPVTTVPPHSTAANASKSAGAPAEDKDRLISIIGVFSIGKDAAASGVEALLILYALVNISLGIINLVPLLPFDGGHASIAIYEKVQEKRRRLSGRYFTDVQKLLPLTYVVMFVLLAIFVTTTYLDLVNPLKLN